MPPLPSDGSVRLPGWAVGLPWLLLAVSLAGSGWMISNFQRQMDGQEETNAALRRQAVSPLPPPPPAPLPKGTTPDSLRQFALRTTLELAEARGWATAYTLLPEYLPGLVERLGPAPELREIAVTALTRACSSNLTRRSEQTPAFTADSRWIITRQDDGSLVLSDVNFLDPDTFVLKAGARDFRVDASFLYYQTEAGWQRAALRTPPDGQAEIGPAEAFTGIVPEPAPPPSHALILPKIRTAPARLALETGQDPAVPVHPWEPSDSSPCSVVLSPDGRFAAVWLEKNTIRVWRLAMLRERLARLGLDWNVPDLPPSVNHEAIEGFVGGSVRVPPAAPPAASNDSPPPPRRRVILPTASEKKEERDALSKSFPVGSAVQRPAEATEPPESVPSEQRPRRRVVLPDPEESGPE